MKAKKHYIRSSVECIALLEEYSLLGKISLEIGSGPAPGGGDAKQGFFEEEEEEASNNIWQTEGW